MTQEQSGFKWCCFQVLFIIFEVLAKCPEHKEKADNDNKNKCDNPTLLLPGI